MPSPDIIRPINSTPGSGVETWSWIDSVSIDRNGTKHLMGGDDPADRWRISTVVRQSLAKGGQLVLVGGQEVPAPPSPGIKSQSWDVADMAAVDPRVMQAFALIRDILIDAHLRDEAAAIAAQPQESQA